MELDAREFAVLCQCPLFAGVVPAALPALLRALHADAACYGRGSVLLLAGYENRAIGIVLRGGIAADKVAADGTQLTIAHMGAGGILGDVLSSSHVKSPVSVTATAPTRVLWLPIAALFAAESSGGGRAAAVLGGAAAADAGGRSGGISCDCDKDRAAGGRKVGRFCSESADADGRGIRPAGDEDAAAGWQAAGPDSAVPLDCETRTRLLQNLLGIISDKYFALDRRIELLMQHSLRARVLHYLTHDAQRAQDGSLLVPFTRAAWAQYLGCDRAALCRELGRMQKDGVLRMEKRRFWLTPSAPRS